MLLGNFVALSGKTELPVGVKFFDLLEDFFLDFLDFFTPFGFSFLPFLSFFLPPFTIGFPLRFFVPFLTFDSVFAVGAEVVKCESFRDNFVDVEVASVSFGVMAITCEGFPLSSDVEGLTELGVVVMTIAGGSDGIGLCSSASVGATVFPKETLVADSVAFEVAT